MNKHISMKYWTPEWPIMMVDKGADRLHFAELVETSKQVAKLYRPVLQ